MVHLILHCPALQRTTGTYYFFTLSPLASLGLFTVTLFYYHKNNINISLRVTTFWKSWLRLAQGYDFQYYHHKFVLQLRATNKLKGQAVRSAASHTLKDNDID